MKDGFGMTLVGGTTGAVANLIGGTLPGWVGTAINTTTHSTANGVATKIKSQVTESEDSTFTIAVEPAQLTTFYGLRTNRTAETWTINIPSLGGAACSGLVIGFAPQDVGDGTERVTCTITIAWSGPITFTAA